MPAFWAAPKELTGPQTHANHPRAPRPPVCAPEAEGSQQAVNTMNAHTWWVIQRSPYSSSTEITSLTRPALMGEGSSWCRSWTRLQRAWR